MNHQYIVAGISTEIGKTVVSAILCEALKADYWKPVQAGELDRTDTDKVRQWVSNPYSQFHPEAYRLKHPMSPHAAAALEGIRIDPQKLILPDTTWPLIVELAGGLMVPLTEDFLNIHLIQQLGLPVILVANYYLGSINHTLLSIEGLKQYDIPIKGIIFNGEKVETTFEVIQEYAKVLCLGEVGWEEEVNAEMVGEWAERFRAVLV